MMLTDRQAQVYEFILAYIEEHGAQPTYREMMDHFGFRSPNGILCHMLALQRKKLVRLPKGKSRNIELIGVTFKRVCNGQPAAQGGTEDSCSGRGAGGGGLEDKIDGAAGRSVAWMGA